MNKNLDIERLYILYEQPMYRIAYSILHNVEQSEDAVSDAFYKILKHPEKIVDIDSLKTKRYITLIIKNTALDQYRKNMREYKHTIPIDESIVQISDNSNLEEQITNDACNKNTVANIFTLVGDLDKQILYMRCCNEMTFADIAIKLSLSEANVRKRFQRAKQNIIKQKGEFYYEKFDI